MSSFAKSMTISALGKACTVSTPTIRYYEGIKLLPKPERSQSGQRRYNQNDIERLTFIRRCRDFGFSIEQVRRLVNLSKSSEMDCRASRDIAQNYVNEINKKVVELKALQTSLKKLVTTCEETCIGGTGQDCVAFSQMQLQSG